MKRKGERKQHTTTSLGLLVGVSLERDKAKGRGSEAMKDIWSQSQGGRVLSQNPLGHKKKKCSK